jgi:hypothetical protein
MREQEFSRLGVLLRVQSGGLRIVLSSSQRQGIESSVRPPKSGESGELRGVQDISPRAEYQFILAIGGI